MALAREGRLMAPARGRTVPVGQPMDACTKIAYIEGIEEQAMQHSARE
jgi:hypothetical protein